MEMETTLKKIKSDILKASYDAKACHIGSALSAADILVPLFYGELDQSDDAIFIFGKASGVAAYYSILYNEGHFSYEEFVEYLKKYPLPSTEVPKIYHTFGSVGHALSVAAGAAYASPHTDFYVLLSDGDLMEGSTYEAALFINQHNLENLHVIVDDNKLVACGAADDILKIDYDFYERNIPNFRRMETIKGSGVSFMEGDYTWHYQNLTKELLDKALDEIHG